MTERLTTHLSSCKECARELAVVRREQEIYSNYQRDIEVTPAQWNIVQARIEQEKDSLSPGQRTTLRERLNKLFHSRKQFRPAFVAALVLIVVGIVASLVYLNSRQRQAELAHTPEQTFVPAPVVVKPDAPAESNQSNGQIASDATPKLNNSNRQRPTRSTKAPVAADEQRTTAEVARTRRREKPVVKERTPDETASFETIAANRDNSINGARTNAFAATGNFDFEIARHAERAQLLLRSFRNVRMPANARSLDVAYERENARKLLYQNIALRREASARRDEGTAEVLNTLEPILLDIANLPNRARVREVRSIEQHMKKKEIVATLQVRTLVAAN
jgi:hypothetical protein